MVTALLTLIIRATITLGFFAAGAFVIVGVARVIGGSRRRSAGLSNAGPLEERIARLEHAIEGLTIENQRLVEGQRFFTQLMAQRPVPSISAGPQGDLDGSRQGR